MQEEEEVEEIVSQSNNSFSLLLNLNATVVRAGGDCAELLGYPPQALEVCACVCVCVCVWTERDGGRERCLC